MLGGQRGERKRGGCSHDFGPSLGAAHALAPLWLGLGLGCWTCYNCARTAFCSYPLGLALPVATTLTPTLASILAWPLLLPRALPSLELAVHNNLVHASRVHYAMRARILNNGCLHQIRAGPCP